MSTIIESEKIITDNETEYQAEWLTPHIMMRVNIMPDPEIPCRKLMSIVLMGRDYPSLTGHTINDNEFRFSVNIPPIYESDLSNFAANVEAFKNDWEYLKQNIIAPLKKEKEIR